MTAEGVASVNHGAWTSVDVSAVPAPVAEALTAFMAATDAPTAADPRELDGAQAAAVASVLAAGTSRLSVAKARLLPVIDADGLWAATGARSFPVWVAAAHRVSISTARAQVRLGRALRDHLPTTADAAAAGVISAEHAQVLATHTTTSPQRCRVLADPDHDCSTASTTGPATTHPPPSTTASCSAGTTTPSSTDDTSTSTAAKPAGSSSTDTDYRSTRTRTGQSVV